MGGSHCLAEGAALLGLIFVFLDVCNLTLSRKTKPGERECKTGNL